MKVSLQNGYLLNETKYEANLEYKDSKTPIVEVSVDSIVDKEPTGKIIAYKVSENNDKISDVEITIEANEKITNKAGTITYYNKGDIVDILTTDITGKIEKSGLPLRKILGI